MPSKSWTVPTLLMEDHRDAYFFWRELGLRGQTCVHVDAHLDLSNMRAPACEDSEHPQINCGNYLLPAITEDIVRELIWVIPYHLPKGEELLQWTLQELQNWLHLDVQDYLSLKIDQDCVQGTLLGRPFTLCYSHNLPPINGPVLLDVDVDYYLDAQDGIWQSPMDLARQVNCNELTALTVAYSVQGGYTPALHRPLGPLTVLALASPELATRAWNQLHCPSESVVEPLEPWLAAARAALSGDWDKAACIDPAYRVQALDQVCAALMRQRFTEAQAYLPTIPDTQEALYLEGMLAFKTQDFRLAANTWGKLLDSTLDALTRTHLLIFCARAQMEMRDHGATLESLQEAQKLAPRDPEISQLLARTQRELGDLEQAGRLYRRAIKLAPNRLESFEQRLELSEIYAQLGQTGLAQRLLKQILRSQTPGFIKHRAETLRLKLALGKSV